MRPSFRREMAQYAVDDAANLVLFLACDDSAFITGTNMDLNGGMLFS